jgi:hypothetical protein
MFCPALHVRYVRMPDYAVIVSSGIIIRNNPNFSSERMLHKVYYRKDLVKKISGRESQGAWRQDELISSKSQVVK